ncbi:MAG: hypothetical protein VKJ06_04915 [Vampirovibrionales bacterium]|nr:hypothetical protein [Vampirovibrionales bacterium]
MQLNSAAPLRPLPTHTTQPQFGRLGDLKSGALFKKVGGTQVHKCVTEPIKISEHWERPNRDSSEDFFENTRLTPRFDEAPVDTGKDLYEVMTTEVQVNSQNNVIQESDTYTALPIFFDRKTGENPDYELVTPAGGQ